MNFRLWSSDRKRSTQSWRPDRETDTETVTDTDIQTKINIQTDSPCLSIDDTDKDTQIRIDRRHAYRQTLGMTDGKTKQKI